MQKKSIFVTRASMPPYVEYAEAIKKLWDSRQITNMGIYHGELERKLKEYLDVSELSLMVNGHMSLELAIQMMQFPDGMEVITTPFTFVSTTHAIIRNRLKPVFCDVKSGDATIDETKIENLITEKTVAIIPVHVYGNVCCIEEIQRIADKYNIKVIYDAAHAFGVRYKGKGIGNYGDASIFSFHATKVFNTVEGGAVAFRKHQYYEKLYNLKNFGIREEEWVTEVGSNAKMNEFCAIMGLCNLKYIDQAINERKGYCEEYKKQLKNIAGIRFLDEKQGIDKNYGYFPIIVEEECVLNRNAIYDLLKENDIHARKYFYPLTSDQACFEKKYQETDLHNARRLAEEVLVLPLYEGMGIETVLKVTGIIKSGIVSATNRIYI